MNANIFSAIIVIIVGLYDLVYAWNKYKQQNSRRGGVIAFAILGVIFTIGGIVLLITRL